MCCMHRCMCTVIRGTVLGCFISTQHAQTGRNGETNAVNCSNINTTGKPSSSCSSFSWSMAYSNDRPGNCSAKNYTGSVCRPQLLLWQDCSVGSRQDVLLDLTLMEHSQEERERDVAQLLHFLREFEMAIVRFTISKAKFH